MPSLVVPSMATGGSSPASSPVSTTASQTISPSSSSPSTSALSSTPSTASTLVTVSPGPIPTANFHISTASSSGSSQFIPALLSQIAAPLPCVGASQLPPPPAFDFLSPESWPAWSLRFTRYRRSTGLSSCPEHEQVDHLIYVMGPQAEELLCSFHLFAGESELFQPMFDRHFVRRRKVVYERSIFNSRH